jgi:arylsulfatase A-like enzyme
MKAKHLISILALLLLPCIQATPQSQRPNLLVILTDDQGYHDVSYYGTADIQTPAMDALADTGMRFDNFYANCPVCSPTRAALLSGRYQEYVGVPGVIRTNPRDSWGYLSPDAKLLPDMLKQNGYHTAIVGKWHLGLEPPNIPNLRGFDHFHGYLGDMMDDYWTHRRHGINYMRLNQKEIDPKGHATDLFTDYAMDYLDSRRGKKDPFFLYLAYNAPHFPVQPPKQWLDKVLVREPGINPKRAKLVAFIEHLDDGIGKVVKRLKRNGQYDNTLLVFTSDNGGLLRDMANNGPYRDGKQSVYEGGIRVPTCVVWPGVVEAGSVCLRNSLSMDIYSTLLEAAGIHCDFPLEGISFLPQLKQLTTSEPKRPLFFTRREGNNSYGGLTIQAVRLGDWKLLQNSPFGPQELYNLAKDPQEKNNLIGKEKKIFKQLNTLMRWHLQKAGAVPWQPPERVNAPLPGS